MRESLTAAEKATELVGLLDAAARFVNGERGAGSLDSTMLPWLVALNRIDGVCTTQSCEGHREGHYVRDAHLWIRLSRQMEQRLVRQIDSALTLPRVVSIQVDYTRHKGNVRPVLSLTFEGLERHPSLDGAMAPLVRFLCELAA